MAKSFHRQSGQSLVQVLVSVAIMAVVLTAMSSMFSNLSRESRAMSEKLGAMDFEKLLIASLADGSACLHALNDSVPAITFNAGTSMSETNPLKLNLASGKLYSSYTSTPTPATGPVIAEVGKPVASHSPTLEVSSISLELTDISGPVNDKTVLGRWRVDFNGNKLVRPIRPAYVSMRLKADATNGANSTFKSCQTTNGGTTGSANAGQWCGAFTLDGSTSKVVTPCQGKTGACPSGAQDMGGWCKTTNGYIVQGVPYTPESLCPQGYTFTKIMSMATSYNQPVGDVTSGSFYPGGVNMSDLATCVAN